MALGEIDSQHHRFGLFVESSKEYVQKISRQHYCSKVSLRHLIAYTEEI